MRRHLFWFVFLVVTGYMVSCGSGEKELEAELEAVRQEFAPDKRVARWEVEVRRAGGRYVLRGETNLPEAKATLFERLQAQGMEVVDSLQVLPEASLEGRHFGVVQLSVCNIRSQPRHSAELATQATLGTPLRVWKRQGEWFLVQTPDRYLGWLDEGGFAALDSSAFLGYLQAPKVIFLEPYGLAYAAPDPAADPVCDLIAGNILRFLREERGWAILALPDGREAFVPMQSIQPLDDWLRSLPEESEALLATARRFLGRPYLWGGTSGKGMDCSGFTKTVFFLHGRVLPRDASQQVHAGVEVPTDTATWANLQPGDLLFFGRKATPDSPERIWHVAIWLGDGKIIHATGSVRIQSLRRGDPDFAEDRLQTFVRARRLLGPEPLPEVLPLAQTFQPEFYGFPPG